MSDLATLHNPTAASTIYTADELDHVSCAELSTCRTLTSKTYGFGTGQYQTVIYSEAAHRRDASGEWQDIDHQFQKQDGALIDKNENLLTKLEADGSIHMEREGFSLTWRVEDAAKTQGWTIEKDPFRYPHQDENSILHSEAAYGEIFPGVSVHCQVSEGTVKDAVVFAAPETVRPINYEITAPGLRAKPDRDGAVLLLAKDREIYRLEAPAVSDCFGNPLPGSVHTTWEEIAEGRWRWTVQVDMRAVEAAYAENSDVYGSKVICSEYSS